MKKITLRLALFALASLIAFSGCNNTEIEQMKSENERLKSELQKNQATIQQLKETAQFHYQQASDYLKTGSYHSAQKELAVVLEKFPADPLIPAAREAMAKVETLLADQQETLRREMEARQETLRREQALSGEPIDYPVFFAKAKTGLPALKRFRFTAKISAPSGSSSLFIYRGTGDWKEEMSQQIVAEPDFDDPGEYERWLATGKEHRGIIVASVSSSRGVVIHRLH